MQINLLYRRFNNCYGQTCGNSCSGSCDTLCSIECDNSCVQKCGADCYIKCTNSCITKCAKGCGDKCIAVNCTDVLCSYECGINTACAGKCSGWGGCSGKIGEKKDSCLL